MLAKLFAKKNEDKHAAAGESPEQLEGRIVARVFELYQSNYLTDPELLRLCAYLYGGVQQEHFVPPAEAYRAHDAVQPHDPAPFAPHDGQDFSHSDMAAPTISIPIQSDEPAPVDISTDIGGAQKVHKIAIETPPDEATVTETERHTVTIRRPQEPQAAASVESADADDETYASPADRIRRVLMIDKRNQQMRRQMQQVESEEAAPGPPGLVAPMTMHTSAYTSSGAGVSVDIGLNEPEVVVPIPRAEGGAENMIPFTPSKPSKVMVETPDEEEQADHIEIRTPEADVQVEIESPAVTPDEDAVQVRVEKAPEPSVEQPAVNKSPKSEAEKDMISVRQIESHPSPDGFAVKRQPGTYLKPRLRFK